jgi:hypothetical protein
MLIFSGHDETVGKHVHFFPASSLSTGRAACRYGHFLRSVSFEFAISCQVFAVDGFDGVS